MYHSESIVQTKKLNYTLKKINHSELLKDSEIKESLPFFEQRFSNKKTQNSYSQGSTQLAEGLTILTEEINRIVTEGVVTWTFEIETPILKESDFENFFVKKHNNKFSYYLISYEKDLYNEKDLYKKVNLYQIDKEKLDLVNLNYGLPNLFTDDSEDGGGGGETGQPCEGILVGYDFEACNQGGYHSAGTYCCQHPDPNNFNDGIHGCSTIEDFYGCGNTCNGTKNIPIYDFSNCEEGTYPRPSGPTDNHSENNSTTNNSGAGTQYTTSNEPTITIPLHSDGTVAIATFLENILNLTEKQTNWIENQTLEEQTQLFNDVITNEEIDLIFERAFKMYIDVSLKSNILGPYNNNYFETINKYVSADLMDPIMQQIWIAHFSVQCAIIKQRIEQENPGWCANNPKSCNAKIY